MFLVLEFVSGCIVLFNHRKTKIISITHDSNCSDTSEFCQRSIIFQTENSYALIARKLLVPATGVNQIKDAINNRY